MQQIQLTQAYQRFVPKQLLQNLKKDSILDVKLGDQVNMEMSIIDLVKYDENGINTSTDQDSLIHLIYNKIIFEGNLDTLIQINAITDEQTHTLDSARFNDVTIIETLKQ